MFEGGRKVNGIQVENTLDVKKSTPFSMDDFLRVVSDDSEMSVLYQQYVGQAESLNSAKPDAQNPFEFISYVEGIDTEKAYALVNRMAQANLLPRLFYEHESTDLTEDELTLQLNAHRFGSARESFLRKEMAPLDHEAVNQATAYLTSLRASYGLPQLHDIEQIIQVKTEPFENKNIGYGVAVPKEPFIFVSTPDHVSTLKFTIHELAHVFHYNKCVFRKDENGEIDSLFTNIGISHTDERDSEGRPIRKLRSLNEALTEELSKRYVKSEEARGGPFRTLIDEQNKKIAEYRALHPDELLTEEWDDVVAIHTLPDGTEYPALYSYEEERRILQSIITEIALRLSTDEGNAVDENSIFEMLIKAQFTGDMRSFRDLFDRAFGEGSFALYEDCKNVTEEVQVLTNLGIQGL